MRIATTILSLILKIYSILHTCFFNFLVTC